MARVRPVRASLPVVLGLLLGALPPQAAAPRPAGAQDAPKPVGLVPATLEDPDLVPPALAVEVTSKAVQQFAPLPHGVLIRKTGITVDWDGDGRSETSLRAGRSATVRVAKDGRAVPVLLYERGVRWLAAPAALLRGRLQVGSESVPVELLDGDLDGRFDGPADLLRVGADGAFFAPAPERRLAVGEALLRFTLAEDGGAWSLRLVPEAQPAGTGPVERRGLGAVNAYRSAVGLAPLALDAGWCAGCARHAAYILKNPVLGFGHDERPELPGHSPEGLEAAVEGVMERTGDPAVAVERLTSMLMHRTPFLTDPRVGLGVGSVGGPQPKAGAGSVGTPGFSVLRAGRALTSTALPVVAPGPGQKDVPLTLLEETPTPDRQADLYARPRGYAVSVSFLPREAPAPVLRLRVAGRAEWVPCLLFTPAAPLHASFAHNYATAFLVPEAPLDPLTTYEAECVLGAGDAQRTWVWRFTTRGP